MAAGRWELWLTLPLLVGGLALRVLTLFLLAQGA